MLNLVIPTTFTAIDKMSNVFQRMKASVGGFATSAENGVARSERLFRKLTPALNETQKQMFSMVSAAAIAGTAIGGLNFSIDSIKSYETAVASFRTIVGGSDKEFGPFQGMINQVAHDAKKSSIDVAASFEKIAGLNASFAKTPESIGKVSNAVITLSKASGDQLGPSAESLVGIMNQFAFGADQAGRTINVLAAGAGVGAASIVQTSESFVNFGSVAKGANISLEQSVGLIQTLGKFSVFGAEAGTKLRGSILKLQQAGVGYKSGQFQINDALADAAAKVNKYRTAKEKDHAILKMFGAENIATGKILLENIGTIKEYTAGVTGTNAAQEQAAIRSFTLEEKLNELKAGWINMMTGSDQATSGLNAAKRAIGFVTDNLGMIVKVGAGVLGFFLAWKAINMASSIVLGAYNIALGINSALSNTAAIAVGRNSIALSAYNITTKTVTATTWLWNAALNANPIGIIITTVVALTAAIGGLVVQYNNAMEAMHKQDKDVFAQEVNSVNALTKKYEALGMTKEQAMNRAVRVESIVVEKERGRIQKQIEEEKAKGALGADTGKIQELALKDRALRERQDILTDKTKLSELSGMMDEKNNLVNQATMVQPPDAKLLNPEGAKQKAMISQMEKTNNAKVDININDPSGKADASSDNKHVSIKTTSTLSLPK